MTDLFPKFDDYYKDVTPHRVKPHHTRNSRTVRRGTGHLKAKRYRTEDEGGDQTWLRSNVPPFTKLKKLVTDINKNSSPTVILTDPDVIKLRQAYNITDAKDQFTLGNTGIRVQRNPGNTGGWTATKS